MRRYEFLTDKYVEDVGRLSSVCVVSNARYNLVESVRAARRIGPASRSWMSRLPWIVVAIVMSLIFPPIEGRGEPAIDCLTRQGRKPHFDKKDRARLENKLFLTAGDVARYVFLTNRQNDGDRSAAIYRSTREKRSVPEEYWITATVASDSIGDADSDNITVRRYDAPLPRSTAKAVRQLWLAVLNRTREGNVVICSPTGIFSTTTANGGYLEAVTVSLDGNCWELIQLGESLISYAQMPEAKRAVAARKLEKESHRLLSSVTERR